MFCPFCERYTARKYCLCANTSHLLILKGTLWTDLLVSDTCVVFQAFLLPLYSLNALLAWRLNQGSHLWVLLFQIGDIMWPKMKFYSWRLFAVISRSEVRAPGFVILSRKKKKSIYFQRGLELFTDEKGQQRYLFGPLSPHPLRPPDLECWKSVLCRCS